MSDPRRFSREEVEALYAALKGRFRARGHGSIKKTEQALGLQKDYYSKNRRRGRLDTGVLISTLRCLDVDLGEFFGEVFGDGHRGDGRRGDEAARDPDGEAGGVALVGELETAGESMLRRAAKKSVAMAVEPSGGPSRRDFRDWLARIDDLRYTQPDAAIVEAWSRVDEIPAGMEAPYLAVLGSCYRMIGNLGYARECLTWAMERSGGDDDVLGDVYQRLSYVLAYEGDHAEAVGLTQKACGLYVRSGNWPRVGRALVDQAHSLFYLDELDKAEAALAAAQPHVRDEDLRYTFSIEQYASTIAARRGDVEGCLEHAERARRLAPYPLAEGMLLQTMGELLRGLGQFARASEAYSRALDKVRHNPVNVLRVLVELADCMLHQLRMTKAAVKRRRLVAGIREVADRARSLAADLKGNRLAQAAIDHLALASLDHDLESIAAARNAAEACGGLQPRGDSLGDRVRRFRRIHGLSLDRLAGECGVPAPTLRKIETGATPGTTYRPKLERWLADRRPELSL